MSHSLTARLLQNRASFYQELLKRVPLEKFRIELEHAITDLPDLQPQVHYKVISTSGIDSALLSALELDEWLKKDDIGIRKARSVISIETAFIEACALERLGILLCTALEGTDSDAKETLRSLKTAHERAFFALSKLKDRLEYHRFTLLDPIDSSEDNHIA